MTYKILYSDKAKKALLKLDKLVAKRIHRFLTERVSQDPKNQGGFLQGNFWRCRRTIKLGTERCENGGFLRVVWGKVTK